MMCEKKKSNHREDLPEVPEFQPDIFMVDESRRPHSDKKEKSSTNTGQFRSDIFLADEVYHQSGEKETSQTAEFRADIFMDYNIDMSEKSQQQRKNQKNGESLAQEPEFLKEVLQDYGEEFIKDEQGAWKNQYQDAWEQREEWERQGTRQERNEREIQEELEQFHLEGEFLAYERPYTIRKQEEIAMEEGFFQDVLPLPAYLTGESISIFQFWLCNSLCIVFARILYLLYTHWLSQDLPYSGEVLVSLYGHYLGILQVLSVIQILRQFKNHKGELAFYLFAATTFQPILFMGLYFTPMDIIQSIFLHIGDILFK